MGTQTSNIIFAPTRRSKTKTSKVPAYKAMVYTFGMSAHFMGATVVGKQSVGLCDRLMVKWSKRIFKAGDGTLKVTGIENIKENVPYVFMSNHRSLLDSPAMYGAVPGSLRMVFKEELRKIPVWGNALVASGFIPVDRKNTKRAIEQMNVAKEQIAKGISVWIAPEGTRSRSGALQRFKKGGFHLAKQLGVQIVPCWIEGTDDIIPPDDFTTYYGREATVHFGKPMNVNDLPVDEMITKVRDTMVALGEKHGAPTQAVR